VLLFTIVTASLTTSHPEQIRIELKANIIL